MPLRINVKKATFFGDVDATSEGLRIRTDLQDVYLTFDDEKTAEDFKYLIGVVTLRHMETKKGAKIK